MAISRDEQPTFNFAHATKSIQQRRRMEDLTKKQYEEDALSQSPPTASIEIPIVEEVEDERDATQCVEIDCLARAREFQRRVGSKLLCLTLEDEEALFALHHRNISFSNGVLGLKRAPSNNMIFELDMPQYQSQDNLMACEDRLHDGAGSSSQSSNKSSGGGLRRSCGSSSALNANYNGSWALSPALEF